MILSIIVTPSENSNIFNYATSPPPVFRQCHLLQPIQHCWSQCRLACTHSLAIPKAKTAPLVSHRAVILSLIHTHVFCLSPIDFHHSSLQLYLQLSSFSSTCSLLSLQITCYVTGKHHGPWSFLSDLIRHPIHHHCKQIRDQSRCSMQSHLQLEPLLHSYHTPHRCCTVLVGLQLCRPICPSVTFFY